MRMLTHLNLTKKKELDISTVIHEGSALRAFQSIGKSVKM